jgi:hypothetical protein
MRSAHSQALFDLVVKIANRDAGHGDFLQIRGMPGVQSMIASQSLIVSGAETALINCPNRPASPISTLD